MRSLCRKWNMRQSLGTDGAECHKKVASGKKVAGAIKVAARGIACAPFICDNEIIIIIVVLCSGCIPLSRPYSEIISVG